GVGLSLLFVQSPVSAQSSGEECWVHNGSTECNESPSGSDGPVYQATGRVNGMGGLCSSVPASIGYNENCRPVSQACFNATSACGSGRAPQTPGDADYVSEQACA